MKKKKIIILIIILVLLAAGLTTFFILKNKKKSPKKTYEKGSVEAEADVLIQKWFDAMKAHDVNTYMECCYTDELKKYYMDKTGLDEDSFNKYIEYTISQAEFEYRNLIIGDKKPLSEDDFIEINKELGEINRITHMYEIDFTYEILYDNEWIEADESRKVAIIGGKCYIIDF